MNHYNQFKMSDIVGIYGVPIQVVADALLEALMMFDSSRTKSSRLKEIHVVDIFPRNIQVLPFCFVFIIFCYIAI